MKFSEYPFLRYVIFYALGVIGYPFFVDLPVMAYVGGALCFLMLGYLLILLINAFKRSYRFKVLLPFLSYIMLFLSGILVCGQKVATNKLEHLSNFKEVDAYVAVVSEYDQQKANSIGNRLMVYFVKNKGEWKAASGEVLVYHRLEEPLTPGQILMLQGAPQRIEAPMNPKEFNYQKFMANKQVYHRQFIGKEVTRLGDSQENGLQQNVLSLRKSITSAIDQEIKDDRARQVAQALLVGQKSQLEEQVSEAYVTAGAMHILAVSGLHVGMIYGVFFLFFKPSNLKRLSKILLLTAVILLVWLYALLTGMSPSVLRAATMFTLISLSQMRSSSPSIFNSLALSAMILMAFNPFIIFEVGFQLSYAAMVGILLLQPLLVSFWLPKNRLVFYAWEITTVSIAAQLATFPLSVYYFHVFPNYFLLSNLVAIPGAFLVMSVGLPFMVLSTLDVFLQPFSYLLEHLLKGLNYLIFLFQDLPMAQSERIFLDFGRILLIWGILACAYLLLSQRKKQYAYWVSLLMALLVVWPWLGYKSKKQEVYVYALKNEDFVVDFYADKSLYSYQSLESIEDINYHVSPLREAMQPLTEFQLMGLKTEGADMVLLPNGGKIMRVDGKLKVAGVGVKSMAAFEKGEWIEREFTDSLLLNQFAYRLILK
ncbi:ComEC family competence protein [Echinicola sp. CAU 1574]|uniref:ComEC family competence protein n=1 Tax=Echinicola arenosa TaxID=2774144 RepID=A0ABR9AN91_9BACT|nr:ComEC/Rec2 family competence protein [Echinicola arenosa]MBD8490180.1 ComEC family competence protein [Echinicola arenosa]